MGKEALVTKVVTQQQKITTEKQREIARVEADTTVISAKADSTVTIIGAKATAEATKLVQFAEADAYELQQNSYANGYKDIASSLVFSGDQLLRYIWARSISGAGTNKDLIVALDGTTIKTESLRESEVLHAIESDQGTCASQSRLAMDSNG